MRRITEHGCELSERDIEMLETLVPENLRGALRRYIEFRIPPGDFLRAVLSNDLFEAVGRADMASLAALPNLVIWLHNYTPSGCHGSPAAFAYWLSPEGEES